MYAVFVKRRMENARILSAAIVSEAADVGVAELEEVVLARLVSFHTSCVSNRM
jgi:hypothetical protein